jgi:hypothetical protein
MTQWLCNCYSVFRRAHQISRTVDCGQQLKRLDLEQLLTTLRTVG